jgi:hypothetical protein
MQEEEPGSGGGFVRRMSALARKGRGRSKRDAPFSPLRASASTSTSAAPSAHATATATANPTTPSLPAAADAFVNVGLELWHEQRREWKTPLARAPKVNGGGADDRLRGPTSTAVGDFHAGLVPDRLEDAVTAAGVAKDEFEEDGVGDGEDAECEEDPGDDEAMDDVHAQDLYSELLAPQYTPFPRKIALASLIPVLLDVWKHDGIIG